TREIDPRLAVTIYAYDPVGNRIRITDPDLNDTILTYDRLNRIVRDTNSQSASRTFSYDAVGNELSITDRNSRTRSFNYDALNRVTREEWIEAGNVVRSLETSYDGAGRAQAIGDTDWSLTYSYDASDRPLSVSNAGTGAPGVTWNYTYDAGGN